MSKCTCIEQDGHEQDCPNRPLRPGDYVRWENIGWGTFLWIEGVLVSLEPNPAYTGSQHARIDIKRSCGFAVGTTQTVGVERGVTLRRCERDGDGTCKTYGVWNPAGEFGLTMTGGIEIWGSVPGVKLSEDCAVSPAGIRLRGDSDHRVDSMRYAMKSLGTYDEMFAKIQQDIVDCKFKVSLDASWVDHTIAEVHKWGGIPGMSKASDTTPAPGPVLYDGLTAELCLELYVEAQRHESEPARKLLTTARLAAARELWSAQLRAKREAAKEKERCAVTYCEIDSEDL